MLYIKDIAIIVPFHKDTKMLELSLQTLTKTFNSGIPEIIVIANNANSKEININLDTNIFRIYKIEQDIFWPGAVNYGARMTDKKYLLFCDPDIFYMPRWLEELISCYNRNAFVGAVSAKLVNPLNNQIMDFGMGYNSFNTIHISKGLPFNHPYTQTDRKVQGACGAILLTSHDLFDSVKGIDTSMPYIYCDNDYSIKVGEQGYTTWVAAKSIVYHKGNTDPNNSKYQKYSYLREDSKASFYAKNQDKRKIDFDYWLQCAWEWYLKNTNNMKNNYCLFDFCTLPDHKSYIDELKHLGLHIIEERRIVLPVRDMDIINLCNYISPQMITSKLPFIYFVDDFTSLSSNMLWLAIRDTSNDLVVDRQCNILNMTDIYKYTI
ncbi:MAG: glycosyltransferase family 2 protein [Lachnospiraceae bacterium]|nr:glycosyltransferase family 2 protein [Lachnospiraceae bacterium]